MHNLDNDGFAVLTYDVINSESLPVLLFSGSYRKCIDFIKTAKSIVFRAGLVFCSAAEAKEYLKTWDSAKGGEKQWKVVE